MKFQENLFFLSYANLFLFDVKNLLTSYAYFIIKKLLQQKGKLQFITLFNNKIIYLRTFKKTTIICHNYYTKQLTFIITARRLI